MSNGIKLCRSCMRTVPADAGNCPNCGYNGSQQNDNSCLPIGYRLAGRYIIGMRKSFDGDSSTYIAFDRERNKAVEIKEFLPQNFCARNPETMELVPYRGTELLYKTSLMDFCELYKNLRKIEGNPGILSVYDFVEINSTAYSVIDSFDGISLREFLSMAGGKITCEQAIKLLTPVFNALDAIHTVNLIHRGISPETIFVNRNGDVRLGGFATSLVRTKGTEVEAKLYSGFAAPEQYSSTMWQGTATDVYALAGVFYRCVTGITPQDADQRRGYDTLEPLDRVGQTVSPAISRVVSLAMLIDSQERIQYASEFLEALKNPAVQRDNIKEANNFQNQAVFNPAAADDAGRYNAGSDDSYDDEYDDTEYEDRPARPSRGTRTEKKKQRYPLWIQKLGVRNFWVIIGVLGVTLIGIVSYLFINSLFFPHIQGDDVTTTETGTAIVPNYVGLELEEVIGMLDNNNFTYAYQYVFESEDDVGVVVRQTPEEGTEVAQQTCITLIINKGLRVVVPNVVGMQWQDAAKTLKDEGLGYEIRYEISDRPEGEVLKQSIARGYKVEPDTVIVLTVAVVPSEKPSDEEEGESEDDGETGGESDGGETTEPGGVSFIINCSAALPGEEQTILVVKFPNIVFY